METGITKLTSLAYNCYCYVTVYAELYLTAFSNKYTLHFKRSNEAMKLRKKTEF